jgi:hypothetical protein
MTAKQARWRCIWVGVTAAGALGGLYFLVVGRPTTPMTVACADRLFGQGVQPGQTRGEVEAWLATQGIPHSSATQPERISYDISRRREDVTFKGWWMDCRGSRTVAECAGLDVDAVYSVIRVSYPDAERHLIGNTEVLVYLFFDADGRLIRYWPDEFHWSL